MNYYSKKKHKLKQIIQLSIFILFSLVSTIGAQDINKTLFTQIEENNPFLESIRKNIEVVRLENTTGIYLENPELEFGYLLGAPSEIGKRLDFGLSQSFDFPTTYKLRKKVSNKKNDLTNLDYEIEKMAIYQEVREIITKLRHNSKLEFAFDKRLDHAKRIHDSYAIKLENGEATIFDLNKAKLNHLNLTQELENFKSEKTYLEAQLIRLNGGKEISISPNEFTNLELPPSFEDWFSAAGRSNPIFRKLSGEIGLSETEEKLAKAERLPNFTAAFISESVEKESFGGLSLGMSIPLWENKNKVRLAEAKTRALISSEKSSTQYFKSRMEALFNKVGTKTQQNTNFRSAFESIDNDIILQKALNAGQITLIEYLQEMSYYYESEDKVLEMEKEVDHLLDQLLIYLD